MSAAAPRRECAGAPARSPADPIPVVSAILARVEQGPEACGEARPTFCLFEEFCVSGIESEQTAREEALVLPASVSSSEPSGPSFHILRLTVWDLPRFIPHPRAQSMHSVQLKKMRAHPLPFSAAGCRQPSPLSLAVAVAGVPAPRSGTRSARPRIRSAFAECRPAGLGDKNSPVRASERDFSPVSMSTIQSIFAIRLSVAEALS